MRIQTGQTETDFNSTMVRLKENLELAGKQISKFQFHYGTIKSQVS